MESVRSSPLIFLLCSLLMLLASVGRKDDVLVLATGMTFIFVIVDSYH
jgi:hypothetical protein